MGVRLMRSAAPTSMSNSVMARSISARCQVSSEACNAGRGGNILGNLLRNLACSISARCQVSSEAYTAGGIGNIIGSLPAETCICSRLRLHPTGQGGDQNALDFAPPQASAAASLLSVAHALSQPLQQTHQIRMGAVHTYTQTCTCTCAHTQQHTRYTRAPHKKNSRTFFTRPEMTCSAAKGGCTCCRSHCSSCKAAVNVWGED